MSVATQQIVLKYNEEQKLLLKNLINIRFRRALTMGRNLNISVISAKGIQNTPLIDTILDQDIKRNIQIIQLDKLTSLTSHYAINWVNESIAVLSALLLRPKKPSSLLKKYTLSPYPINVISGGYPGVEHIKSVLDLKIYIEAPFYVRLLYLMSDLRASRTETLKNILSVKNQHPIMISERANADIIIQLPHFIGTTKLPGTPVKPEKGTPIISWHPEAEMEITLIKNKDLYCLTYYWHDQPVCSMPLELQSVKKLSEIDFKAF